ncbi:hypothetical protein SAMN06295960_4567, partial [Paenibacillus aquistagni]
LSIKVFDLLIGIADEKLILNNVSLVVQFSKNKVSYFHLFTAVQRRLN